MAAGRCGNSGGFYALRPVVGGGALEKSVLRRSSMHCICWGQVGDLIAALDRVL
ncbi:hypothetical protein [Pseudogemmobacter sp. W21_MBD1_M6]|jgi:hypothetical protein|uniref:hypothetical protein n=1 Tax=Pseudogemmobacter sp. W21_MBD1_M6 TaxID=3240271 RepID=UPI003F94DA10